MSVQSINIKGATQKQGRLICLEKHSQHYLTRINPYLILPLYEYG